MRIGTKIRVERGTPTPVHVAQLLYLPESEENASEEMNKKLEQLVLMVEEEMKNMTFPIC